MRTRSEDCEHYPETVISLPFPLVSLFKLVAVCEHVIFCVNVVASVDVESVWIG